MVARYAAVLAAPHVPSLVASAVLHGLATATAPLALVLLVAQRTGSYAGAGIVSATYIVINGVLAPVWGRCVDRRGPTRTLLPLAVAAPIAFALLVALAIADAPTGALATAAGLAGAGQAPVTSTLRSMWARLVSHPTDMQAANALQSMMYDLFSLTGPPLGGALVALASPEVAIAFAACALLLADLTFALAPPVRAWRPPPAGGSDLLGALRSDGLRTLVACALPAGLAIGIVEIAAPAFADERGEGAAGAIALAGLAAGGIVGAYVYGAVSWRLPAVARYMRLAAGLTAALALAATAGSLAMLAALLFVAGLMVGPITTTIIGLLDDVVPAEARTEAFTWVITAFTAGVAAGLTIGGALHEAAGTGLTLVAASAGALLELAVLVARRRTLRNST
jgi:MFS family permease